MKQRMKFGVAVVCVASGKPTQAQGDLLRTLQSSPFYMDEADWEVLVALANDTFGGFVRRLCRANPQLTKWDIRYCCLSRFNFRLKQIKYMIPIQYASIRRARARAKSHLSVPTASWRDVEKYLKSI